MIKLKLKNTLKNINLFFEFILGSELYLRILRHTIVSKNYFITLKSRPKKNINLNDDIIEINDFSNTAIVIQGPIIFNDDFTYYSAVLYKKLFKNVLIIISTWEGVSQTYINKFKDQDIVFLTNKFPDYNGFSNINMQIVSTLSGIEFAKEKQIKYILKTRTDQRFYSAETLTFLRNYILNETASFNKIIVTSLNTFTNRLFSISDMFQFSDTKTIELFWRNDLVDKDFIKELKFDNNLLRIPEIYLVQKYLYKKNFKMTWTNKSYEEVLLSYFYIIDKESVDLFWNKYNFIENSRLYYNFNEGLIEAGNLYWHNLKNKNA